MVNHLAFVILLHFVGCNEAPLITPVTADSTFGSALQIGVLEGSDMKEASGIVASIQNPGMWWIINDSGYDPIIYLVDSTGIAAAHFRLDGVNNRDWEDLSIRLNPLTGKSELLIAEIGDNSAKYEIKHIYVVDEPNAPDSNLSIDPPRIATRIYSFVYPDGMRDAETMMVDPSDHSWYVISKREEEVRLYQFSPDYIQRMDQAYSEGVYDSGSSLQVAADTLKFHLTLPFTGAVAGDISQDGNEVVVKSYIQVFYWRRDDITVSLSELLTKPGVPQPYIPEAQGESIAFERKHMAGYVTVSEKSHASDQPFLFYPRLKK
jgi:hypothetical protein